MKHMKLISSSPEPIPIYQEKREYTKNETDPYEISRNTISEIQKYVLSNGEQYSVLVYYC